MLTDGGLLSLSPGELCFTRFAFGDCCMVGERERLAQRLTIGLLRAMNSEDCYSSGGDSGLAYIWKSQ